MVMKSHHHRGTSVMVMSPSVVLMGLHHHCYHQRPSMAMMGPSLVLQGPPMMGSSVVLTGLQGPSMAVMGLCLHYRHCGSPMAKKDLHRHQGPSMVMKCLCHHGMSMMEMSPSVVLMGPFMFMMGLQGPSMVMMGLYLHHRHRYGPSVVMKGLCHHRQGPFVFMTGHHRCGMPMMEMSPEVVLMSLHHHHHHQRPPMAMMGLCLHRRHHCGLTTVMKGLHHHRHAPCAVPVCHHVPVTVEKDLHLPPPPPPCGPSVEAPWPCSSTTAEKGPHHCHHGVPAALMGQSMVISGPYMVVMGLSTVTL